MTRIAHAASGLVRLRHSEYIGRAVDGHLQQAFRSCAVRRLLIVGLTTLGLSSVLGIFAHDFHVLLLTRILQSAGSGVMAGLGLVLASRYIGAERRGAAIAMISAGSAMAFGLGPIVGGLISEYFGWNGLFAVTCLVLLVMPVLFFLLPKEQPRPAAFDLTGAALLIVNAATLLASITGRSAVWLAVSLVSLGLVQWYRGGSLRAVSVRR
ncbi:DHA2 family metal-tetracycline-proton antiporter-like MFS transporter [Paenibacillus forsythiae]|uniref:DHA2 family metal-tetracycline-proton antiporter-like MFS transporter n=1 Tax=Paenibacillus forsythiae TaxID=365616 RepID=A0ABU3H3I7_9BACL|nr:MFS transporter [Paenibacillus forsythiae]MDT3425388.1 DHA2 family metal-tetracycline-proton antiporter-like MFS transporter [Paenibacillus forsythiae]